jgi:hypothetical protein
MNKDIIAIGCFDKTKTLRLIKPFDCSFYHGALLLYLKKTTLPSFL